MPLDTKKLHNIFNDTTEVVNYRDDDTMEYETENESNDITEMIEQTPQLVKRNANAKEITTKDVDADVDFSLRAVGDMINQAQRLVQLSLENVEQNGTPRDTEVAANAINTAVNAAEKLIAIHEKLQKIKTPISQQTGNTMYVQNQNVFHGSTADAIRAIRNGDIEV